MLTVALVCVPGGIYKRCHVDRLLSQIKVFLMMDYEICVIDKSDKPGWWAKIDLFQPGRFKGRVLYLDLDVTVVGLLDDLVTYPFSFSAIRDWQNSLKLNSSVMAWDAGVADHVYTDFSPEVMKRLRGDQDWIHERMTTTHFPRSWCLSYKVDVLTGKQTPDARVIAYHGDPKPWDDV